MPINPSTSDSSSSNTLFQLRDSITNAYRKDETECVNNLLSNFDLPEQTQLQIDKLAKDLASVARAFKKKQGRIDALLTQYDLSSEEGVALMCLAEALLRIPDTETIDKLISDKISNVEWRSHLNISNPLFINAATWSLIFTGKIFSPVNTPHLANTLQKVLSRLGVAVIRPFILQMMKAIGKEFVIGETIESALVNAKPIEAKGYLFSFDMLGEEARTDADALTYYNAYAHAIEVIGQSAKSNDVRLNAGISIKLSALNPRYEYKQRERVLPEILSRVLELAKSAKKYNLNLTIDAEEAERLDLSLDIFQKLIEDQSLRDWNGLGLAVQAYQKRAPYVIDWLQAIAKKTNKKIMLRLIKGAYWDSEIKLSQVQGFNDYPVYTRKGTTDFAYLACAKKILSYPDYFYPQFGTHNAYSVAAIMHMANEKNDFEFQCLYGMGRPLYDQIVAREKFNLPCRMYAPVGTHKDLLGYLIRRLLENGANTSFINKLADDSTSIESLVKNPIRRIKSLNQIPNPKIPSPKNIYGYWQNSEGVDLSNRKVAHDFLQIVSNAKNQIWQAVSIIDGLKDSTGTIQPVYSPIDRNWKIGEVKEATPEDVERAIASASKAFKVWGDKPVNERAYLIEQAATKLQANMAELVSILVYEGGKSLLDSIAEVREAIDYCRYYAYRARVDLSPAGLPGPTGESNQLMLYPRGVVACISPWNFPIAIFLGQILAALVTGNTVIAKPAEQTPLIAYRMIEMLHEVGIPKSVLQLLLGHGEIGAHIVNNPQIAGVMFTGSTSTAKSIETALANRHGPIAFLIAETGGQNAMIVDSSALSEQVVMDIVNSAFNSAGQRCSALRVLFVQEEMAERLLPMLSGYMQTLKIGDPALLSTDIGPVIDNDALQMLENHFKKMQQTARLLAQVPISPKTQGFFFAPCAFEIENLAALTGEVFGPILHIIRYKAKDLDKVMEAIVATGYGLTLGIESRIDTTIRKITEYMPIGNIYVNRNMVGAVVGVQPFGGSGLSGTGPKAGGPHYLPCLCLEKTISVNTTAVGGNTRLLSLQEDD